MQKKRDLRFEAIQKGCLDQAAKYNAKNVDLKAGTQINPEMMEQTMGGFHQLPDSLFSTSGSKSAWTEEQLRKAAIETANLDTNVKKDGEPMTVDA